MELLISMGITRLVVEGMGICCSSVSCPCSLQRSFWVDTWLALFRPADVFLQSWSCGRSAALDIHEISPLYQLTLAETSVSSGHALQIGVQRKLASNLPTCRDAGVLQMWNTWGTGWGCHPYHSPFGSSHSRQDWILGPFCLSEASFPEICDLSLVGQCMPLASSSPDYPSYFGWNRLTESVFLFVCFLCLYCILFVCYSYNSTGQSVRNSGSQRR